MAPNRSMGNPYTDDRRGSGPRWESSTYRPGDRDRPQTSRHPRDLPPRPPDIKTNFRPPEGPRKMSGASPASAGDKLGNDLHLTRMNTALEKPVATNSAIIEPPILAIPKAQKPELQEAFEVAYKWGEKSNKRLLLSMRKNKVAQERAQRDQETEKYKAKAGAYPPYHGLSHKPNPADQKLDEQYKAVEDDYRNHLEQLVACFTTVAKPAVSDNQDPVIAALEAKVEQLSQLATKQSEQIQELRDGNSRAGNSVSSLETDLTSLKSSHSDLEARYNVLKSDHETLQSKFRSYNDTIHALESKQVILDAGNLSLKEQLSDIQSSTEEKSGSFDAQMTELVKKTSDIADSWDVSKRSLNERITTIESKSHDYDEFKEMLDELDLAILNQISDAWVSDVYNLKAQHEEYKERRGQDNPSIIDELRSLRQDVESLRSSQPAVSQPDNGLNMSIQKVEELVNAEVTAAEERIINNTRAYSEKKDNLFSELLSDVEARLDTLEQRMPKLETRTQSLEQWKIASSASVDQVRSSDLSERVTRLEGQKIGYRVDKIDLTVDELNQKYEVLKSEVGQLVKQELLEIRLQELLNNVGVNPGLENDVRDLQRKLPAIDLAVKTLDTQFQNLSTKQLAELIVRLTNPTVEQRLGKLEVRASQLEVKANGQDRAIIQYREQLSAILPGEKRTASPSQYDDPNKRRKLEANGRHPSPLQQQQQQSAQNIGVPR
ncbi:hypothetical protein EV127DRAFT_37094 [Xylaria flabelliformis]|nr:hypothetical protein EV127DRAFT_37094 [Xylaria flabelliformis]